MSGVNIVNGYSGYIFNLIETESGVDGYFSSQQENYFVGGSGFIGAALANLSVAFLTRRQIFIGFHLLMGIFLALVGFFID